MQLTGRQLLPNTLNGVEKICQTLTLHSLLKYSHQQNQPSLDFALSAERKCIRACDTDFYAGFARNVTLTNRFD